MSSAAPLLSIITVNLNDRAGLVRTLESVARQSFRDRELIVVDGGSTDGSVEVVRERATAGVVTDWVSEQDGGVYDAQNKGTRRARGTFCLYLNAGDALASDDALERFFAAGPPVEDLLYGDVVFEEEDGRQRAEATPVLTWELLMRTNLPHQATVIRRSLFERVGPYDTGYRIAADYAFFLKAFVVDGATARHVPVRLAIQVMGGRSSRPDAFPLLREERARAKERVLTPALRAQWEAYLAAKRGPLLHHLRNAFRPMSRRLRTWSRRLRRRPDSPV
jgi:glycosyltransferase involved in cell wall biosynthesis